MKFPDTQLPLVGDDRGIHFLWKWEQVNSLLTGAKVNGEPAPPPPCVHGTPFQMSNLILLS